MSMIRVDHLHELLNALSEKTGLSLNYENLNDINDQVGTIGEGYIYKKIFLPIQKLKKNQTIGLRVDFLNIISRFLGHRDFRTFITSLERKEDLQLQSLIGSYRCYVRRNDERPVILCSPGKVFEDNNKKIVFELRGPTQIFSGEIRKQSGCLFILMEAKGGKSFYHVYKIGERVKPNLLQGTFSGVSTAFDPIGGRVVLMRTDSDYSTLVNETVEVSPLEKSKNITEKKLAQYFKNYCNNNISPNRSSTFDIHDL